MYSVVKKELMKQIIILLIASSLLVGIGAFLKLEQLSFIANTLMLTGMAAGVAFWCLLIRFFYLKFSPKK